VIKKSAKDGGFICANRPKAKPPFILLPDPDREGEAISWHLDHIFREDNQNTEIKRKWFSTKSPKTRQGSFLSIRAIIK